MGMEVWISEVQGQPVALLWTLLLPPATLELWGSSNRDLAALGQAPDAPQETDNVGLGYHEGDSGGPLVCDLTNAWVLVGLASWGLDCKYTIYPSDFTSVSYFIDWINEIQKLTSLPDAMSAPPQTQFPYQPLQAAAHLGLTQAL
ncbi:hypothetical protein CB1_107450001 [Camelus ferus]|nr:hypothetical protein CB1_107450001 [Camelus ferus]